jgi:hypothetical protein
MKFTFLLEVARSRSFRFSLNRQWRQGKASWETAREAFAGQGMSLSMQWRGQLGHYKEGPAGI